MEAALHPIRRVLSIPFYYFSFKPPSPEKKCMFDKWNRTKNGDHRIFWAMIKDPQLEDARRLRHGNKLIFK